MVTNQGTSAVAACAERYDAVQAQVARLSAARPPADRWAPMAGRYTRDPHRPLTPEQEAVAAELGPDAVLLDIGGGAGRHGLPLALRCREVVNVEPSQGMRDAFLANAEAAGIRNVRAVDTEVLERGALWGDVVLVSDVTYFVRDIVPFVASLAAAARRVHILLYAEPPPYRLGRGFRVVFGEEAEALPGHRELLPVLWEMGILPDVRVLSGSFRRVFAMPATREDAVQFALERVEATAQPDAAKRVEEHFDRLFERVDGEFRPRWTPPLREMLITWETGHGA